GFAVGASLALGLDGEQIKSTEVLRIKVDGFAEVRNCFGGVSARAFEHTEVCIDLTVARGECVGAVKALFCGIEIALPEREDAPVRPGSGLAGSQLRCLREFALGTDVVAHFHCRQSDIEGSDELRVLR